MIGEPFSPVESLLVLSLRHDRESERMPEAIQLGATVLPLTHAVAIVRPLVTGTPVDSLWPHLAVVLAYAAFGFALATFLIRRRLLA